MRRRESTADAEQADGSTGGRSWFGLRGRIRGLFSIRPFLLALVLSTVGLVVGGSVPVIGVAGRFLGIAVAGFVLAIVWSTRRYAEAGLAGALVAGFGFVLSSLVTPLFPVVAEYGVQVAGIGTTAGSVAAFLGHYLGRDLRAGVTQEL
ncbi:hypothetical protein [Haloplanus sp.]|uniref:hypothetical protein n=1 Tax=Haloplanus sp. TaxID=1961696 RepID=UPI00263525D4|nr:hypothetical protein [Haloplanus sp.]